MKNTGCLLIFKKSNTIKILTLIILVVLPLIGILAYNKSLFEAMTINIYANKDDYEISKEGSSSNSNSNKYKKNSEEIYSASPSDPDGDTSPAPAPKTSVADNASSDLDNSKAEADAKAKETADAIKKKTSGYTNSFTSPLKQGQTEDDE